MTRKPAVGAVFELAVDPVPRPPLEARPPLEPAGLETPPREPAAPEAPPRELAAPEFALPEAVAPEPPTKALFPSAGVCVLGGEVRADDRARLESAGFAADGLSLVMNRAATAPTAVNSPARPARMPGSVVKNDQTLGFLEPPA